MTARTCHQRQYLLEEIFGLAVACPFDQGNPCNCPLHDLRKQGLKERYESLQELSGEDMLKILIFHQKCLEEKEEIKIRPTVEAARAAAPIMQPVTAGNCFS